MDADIVRFSWNNFDGEARDAGGDGEDGLTLRFDHMLGFAETYEAD